MRRISWYKNIVTKIGFLADGALMALLSSQKIDFKDESESLGHGWLIRLRKFSTYTTALKYQNWPILEFH